MPVPLAIDNLTSRVLTTVLPSLSTRPTVFYPPNLKQKSMARLFYSSSLVLLSTLLPILTVQAHEAWPGNFTCPATTKQALAPTLKANGLCDCATGWTGPECGVCTTNEACAAVHGKGATCAQTSFAGEKKLVRTCCVFVG